LAATLTVMVAAVAHGEDRRLLAEAADVRPPPTPPTVSPGAGDLDRRPPLRRPPGTLAGPDRRRSSLCAVGGAIRPELHTMMTTGFRCGHLGFDH
jgi:hypothetical protein